MVQARWVGLWASVALLAACGSGGGTESTASKDAAVSVAETSASSLLDRRWQVHSVGSLMTDPASDTPTWLQIELDPQAAPDAAQHSVQGNTGCNSMRGSASLDGAKLSFGPIATTKRYCPQTAGVETALLAALKEVQSWTISGDELQLLDVNGAGAISLRLIQAAP